MKKYLLVIVLCVCSAGRLMAQSVSGKVVDRQGNPLAYVSVVLQSARDSSYVGGVATDADGSFAIPAKEGAEYALLVSYVGYGTVRKACKAGDAGVIVMKEDATMLGDVSIVASRTRHDAGGYTVNLRSAGIAKGKQSADALAFLPG